MKVITTYVVFDVEVPSTAREWELYSGEPGVGAAATRLTAALKKAANPKLTHDQAWKIISAALDKESKFGATDSEPYYHAKEAFRLLRGLKLEEW